MARRRAALDLPLEPVGVVTEGRLRLLVDVEDDGERARRDDHAQRCTKLARVHSEGLRVLGGSLAAGCDQQHRNGDTQRVGGGQHDSADAELERGRTRRDHAEYRARTGDEDEAEAGAQQEATAEIALRTQPAEAVEGPLEERAEL